MGFIGAIKSGLKKWITFSGRASRSEYWYFVLFYWIAVICSNLITPSLRGVIASHQHNELIIPALIYYLCDIVLLFWLMIGLVSVIVRRLHDVNRSGWWYWIALTIVGALFPLFVWKCTKGSDGENRFGPDPLANP